MTISYNADNDLIKPISRKKNKTEEMIAIEKFLDSPNMNIVFEYDDADTARKKRNNISVHARKDKIAVKALLRGNKVVVLRK